jgi:hypothetical protein
MLGVYHHKVEADITDHLNGLHARRLDECAQQAVAPGQPLA